MREFLNNCKRLSIKASADKAREYISNPNAFGTCADWRERKGEPRKQEIVVKSGAGINPLTEMLFPCRYGNAAN